MNEPKSPSAVVLWKTIDPDVRTLAQEMLNADRVLHDLQVGLIEDTASPEYYIDRAQLIVDSSWYQAMLENAWRYSDLSE